MVKTLLKSFKLSNKLKITFLIELVFMTIIVSLASLFNWLLTVKSNTFSNGQTPEQVKLLFASMGPDQMNSFVNQLQSYLYFLIIGFIIIAVTTLILFSLSRAMIWSKLLKNKLSIKNWKRWVLLNIAILVPILLFLIIYAIVKIMINLIITSVITNNNALLIVNLVINYALFLFLLIFIFLVFYSFAKDQKVWQSIGHSFSLIKKTFWKYYLFVLIVSLLMNVIGYLISLLIASLIINMILLVLFISWARVYLVKVLK
jgi:hypothetical protein